MAISKHKRHIAASSWRKEEPLLLPKIQRVRK